MLNVKKQGCQLQNICWLNLLDTSSQFLVERESLNYAYVFSISKQKKTCFYKDNFLLNGTENKENKETSGGIFKNEEKKEVWTVCRWVSKLLIFTIGLGLVFSGLSQLNRFRFVSGFKKRPTRSLLFETKSHTLISLTNLKPNFRPYFLKYLQLIHFSKKS